MKKLVRESLNESLDESVNYDSIEAVDNFYKTNHDAILKNIIEKFKKIFKYFIGLLPEQLAEEETMEDMTSTFWFDIVEPGWQPAIIRKNAPIDDHHDTDKKIEIYNYYHEKFDEMEKEACTILGLPEEIVEL